jgi:hypothetical protein
MQGPDTLILDNLQNTIIIVTLVNDAAFISVHKKLLQSSFDKQPLYTSEKLTDWPVKPLIQEAVFSALLIWEG